MEENKKRYYSQQNYCAFLLQKNKREYFDNLNENNVNDNKTFWKMVNSFLSKKRVFEEQISLTGNKSQKHSIFAV